MTTRSEDAGQLASGFTSTGVVPDEVKVPDAKQVWFFVRSNSGSTVAVIEQSLDGVLWATAGGVSVAAGVLGSDNIPAPVGLLRCNLTTNTDCDIWWEAVFRKAAG